MWASWSRARGPARWKPRPRAREAEGGELRRALQENRGGKPRPSLRKEAASRGPRGPLGGSPGARGERPPKPGISRASWPRVRGLGDGSLGPGTKRPTGEEAEGELGEALREGAKASAAKSRPTSLDRASWPRGTGARAVGDSASKRRGRGELRGDLQEGRIGALGENPPNQARRSQSAARDTRAGAEKASALERRHRRRGAQRSSPTGKAQKRPRREAAKPGAGEPSSRRARAPAR